MSKYFPFTSLSSHPPTPHKADFSSIILEIRTEEERKTLNITKHSWDGAIPGWKLRSWKQGIPNLFSKTTFSTVTLTSQDLKVCLVITFHHVVRHILFNFRYLSYALQFFLTTVMLNFLFTVAINITFWNYISFSVYEYFLQVPYSHIGNVLQIISNL